MGRRRLAGGCWSSAEHTEPEPCQKTGAADCSRHIPSTRILWHRSSTARRPRHAPLGAGQGHGAGPEQKDTRGCRRGGTCSR